MSSLSERLRPLLFLAPLTVCLGLNSVTLDRSEALARERELFSSDAQKDAPPEYLLVSSLLGGFRGVFTTSLWIRAYDLKAEGQFYEMIDLYRIITRLQPGHAAAWAYQSWDLAYNVSLDVSNDPEDRVFWVFRAIDLLRHEAIPRNPKTAELYWQLGWLFHHKIGFESDDAHLYYRRELVEQVSGVLQGIPADGWPVYKEIAELRERYPDRAALFTEPKWAEVFAELRRADPELDIPLTAIRLLANPPAEVKALMARPAAKDAVRAAGLWGVGERLERDFAMDPALMHELCERFGAIDWRLPEAHSLYWGWLGKRVDAASGKDRGIQRYQFLINHSLIKLVTTGDAVQIDGGALFCVPEYEFIGPVINYLDEVLVEYKAMNERRLAEGKGEIPDEPVRDGYVDFLENMTLNAALDERGAIATALLKKAREISGDEDKYKVDINQFIGRELTERLKTMGSKGLMTLLRIFFVRGCRDLGRGDRKSWQRRLRWVSMLHGFARAQQMANAEAEGRAAREDAVPPLIELKAQIVAEIAEGRIPKIQEPAVIRRLLGTLSTLDQELVERARAIIARDREAAKKALQGQDPGQGQGPGQGQ